MKNRPTERNRPMWLAVVALVAVAASANAQQRDGETVFKEACATCHSGPSPAERAPSLEELRLRSARAVLNAMLLQSGGMRVVSNRLSNAERRAVAEFVTGKRLDEASIDATAGRCDRVPAFQPGAGPSWNGWGNTVSNTRFQPAAQAGLTADQVPRLKLKWVFGFADTAQAWAQPAVAGGRLFVGSQAGLVYALDAKTGCIIWTYTAANAVRTGMVVNVGAAGRPVAVHFSDMAGYTYAVSAENGQLLWRRQVESHPFVRLTGTPILYGGLLYVPTSSFEEGVARENPKCCTFRGSIVALNAGTGQVVWRSYVIPQEPAPRTEKGRTIWGPSGGAIWSSPTVDSRRGLLYVATGNNYTFPATATSDAILALDLHTGKILWSKQLTENDVWSSLPGYAEQSPDFDFGSSPMLLTLPDGRDLIVAPQKSGIGWALDPDKQGAVVWQYRAGLGGVNGGLQWGGAVDDRLVFLAVSDSGRTNPGGLHAIDPSTGQRVWYTPPAPAACETVSRACSAAQSAAITAIPGVVFSGSVDGMFRGYSTRDGSVLWEFNTNRSFTTVNGVAANGGSMNAAGPTVAGGMVYVNSGYGLGQRPGNVLLAFGVD